MNGFSRQRLEIFANLIAPRSDCYNLNKICNLAVVCGLSQPADPSRTNGDPSFMNFSIVPLVSDRMASTIPTLAVLSYLLSNSTRRYRHKFPYKNTKFKFPSTQSIRSARHPNTFPYNHAPSTRNPKPISPPKLSSHDLSSITITHNIISQIFYMSYSLTTLYPKYPTCPIHSLPKTSCIPQNSQSIMPAKTAVYMHLSPLPCLKKILATKK